MGTGEANSIQQRISKSGKIRRPALTAAIALSAGILLDRHFSLPLAIWLALASCSLLSAILLFFSLRPKPMEAGSEVECPKNGRSTIFICAATAVLTLIVSVGGLRHHEVWSTRHADDVSVFATEEPGPVKLIGVIETSVEILESKFGPRIPSWMEIDRSVCVVRCEQLQDGSEWVPISGRVRLDVTGHLIHAKIGDRVQIMGEIAVPRPPSNPGAADYRNVLKAFGADSIVRVSHPIAVYKMAEASGFRWYLWRVRESIRKECQKLFSSQLIPSNAALASSLLIGDRTWMTDDVRQAFAETGAMHLLAISGLNVAILSGLILLICRLLNTSPLTSGTLLICAVGGYALITNHQPSVIRAATLTTLLIVGASAQRRSDGFNSLAACAFLLLLIRPLDLFDIGAQLSFLAVATIFWWTRSPQWHPSNWKPTRIEETQASFRSSLFRFTGKVIDAAGLSVAVWLITLPLTMLAFHLISPVGIPLNIILAPLITFVLGVGYLFLIIGLCSPTAAIPLGWMFEWGLNSFEWLVRWGHSFPGGYVYLPGPSVWWVAGFYLWLAVIWKLFDIEKPIEKLLKLIPHQQHKFLDQIQCFSVDLFAKPWKGLLIWMVLGLVIPLLPARKSAFQCTFLAVGHGLATLIELPTGETILYDIGTLGDGDRAERVVTNAMWSRNLNRIDAVVISHADHDHYNGLFRLIERVPIGAIYLGKSFADPQQPNTMELCETASTYGIPIRILHKGDRLATRRDPQTPFAEVMHPSSDFSAKSDNANSIVLDLQVQNKRILLTGDLEDEGLLMLLKQDSPAPVDVLLAPHHGGKRSNIPALYDWAQPRHVVMSSGPNDQIARLTHLAPDAQVFATSSSGAVTFTLSDDGSLLPVETVQSLPSSPK